ncbi:hypothetical protein BDW75DRAFT_244727 [Aspergillus navahoensis]
MPNLEAIGEGGLRVKAQQTDLPALDTPSLKSLETQISLPGRISRVDLGALQNTNASVYINTNIPVEVHSDLHSVGDISIYGELRTLNLSFLLYADSMTIKSSMLTEYSKNVVWRYRYLNRPWEADFCNHQSLLRAGQNIWPGLRRPTPSFEPTPTPTPYSYTSPTIMPSPSPSPAPGALPNMRLSDSAEMAIVAVFALLLSLSIVWFWTNWGRKMDLEEEYEREQGALLSKAEMEAGDKEGKERLLQDEFEDDYRDAPPPYLKHVQG